MSYGYIHGSAVPIGELGGGRERPPFLLPGSGTAVLRNSHLRNTAWEGRSRPNYPVCYLNSTPEWSRLKAAILRFTRVLSDKNVFT